MNKGYALTNVAYAAKIGGGVIAGYNEVNLLQPGAVALFADDTNAMIDITSPTGELVDIKKVRFAIGKKDSSGAQITEAIDRNKIVNYEAISYAAAAVEVWHIGNNGSTGALNLPTLVAGQEWHVYVMLYNKSSIQRGVTANPKWNFTGVVTASDTAATVLAKVAAAVNANTDCPVTAAVVAGNVGLSFTADVAGDNFLVGRSGIFEDSTITNTTPLNVGANTAAMVTELLYSSDSEFGATDGGIYTNKLFKFQSNYNSATTYDAYVIEFDKETVNATGGKINNRNIIVLFLPVSATIQATFEAMMEVAFSSATTDAIEPADDAA